MKNLKNFVFFNLLFYDKLHFMHCRAYYADVTYVINIIISLVKCNVIERHFLRRSKMPPLRGIRF